MTILIAGGYVAYRSNAPTSDATAITSQPIGTPEHEASTAAFAVLMPVESKPEEPERLAGLEAANAEAPKRASGRQHPAPVSATQRASAHKRPVPERQAPIGRSSPAAHSLAAARLNASVAETRQALRPDRLQVMNVSLAHCSGDLIARIVCHQRVRGYFCEGHWGEAPECPGSVPYKHKP